MDETDVKILKRLLHDARMSYRRVAEEIGVSPGAGRRTFAAPAPTGTALGVAGTFESRRSTSRGSSTSRP